MRLTFVVVDVSTSARAPDAAVRLSDAAGNDVPVTSAVGAGVFEVDVPTGRYRLEANAGALFAPPQDVEVGVEDVAVSVFVGNPDWPFYRLGRSLVPFPPPGNIVAVAYPDAPPADQNDVAARALADAIARLDLEPYRVPRVPDEPETSSSELADGAIRLFMADEQLDERAQAELYDQLQAAVGEQGRVGMPVDLRSGQARRSSTATS